MWLKISLVVFIAGMMYSWWWLETHDTARERACWAQGGELFLGRYGSGCYVGDKQVEENY
jgi:hypothetical protein